MLDRWQLPWLESSEHHERGCRIERGTATWHARWGRTATRLRAWLISCANRCVDVCFPALWKISHPRDQRVG